MKKMIVYALCTFALAFSSISIADIYKCTGDGGAPTFADGNTKTNYKNCQLIMRESGTKAISNKQQTATQSDFPKVDKQTQNQRDDKRKQILLSELDSEQKALEASKNERSQADTQLHQKNIELLHKEVNALK